ncbi:MAG: hypothetical protein ABL904_10015 [Hyphomicrobiaceae bacterium]
MPTIAAIFLAAISLLVGALIEPPAAKAAKKPKPVEAAAADKTDPAQSFRVVSEDLSATASARYAAVVLPRRIAEPEITRIADLVRAKEKTPHEKTVVNFYLPGMKIGHGAWAVATYQPSLKISIFGLRLDEEQQAIAEASSDRRNIIGVWLMAPPAPPGRLAIFKDGGKTFAEWRLRNGTISVEELVQTRDPKGYRLTPVAGATDYYLLGWNGDLELRDTQSVIATGERLPGFGDKATVKEVAKQPIAKSTGGNARQRVQQSAGSSVDAGTALSQQVFKF